MDDTIPPKMVSERPATHSVLLSLSVAAIALRLAQALARASIPYQIDSHEGTILASAIRGLHALPLYPAAGPLPYILSPYGPVGYWLVAGVAKATGVSLIGPRVLAIAGALVIAWLIAAV